MKARSYLTLLLLLLGVAACGQTTYKLEQVTSVESLVADAMYVFEQDGYVMNNTISSSALQTINDYNTTGLTGSESYVWTLVSATGGFYLKNIDKEKFLTNTSSTNLSLSDNGVSIWAFSGPNADGEFLIQNKSNSNRFLGYTSSTSHAYKAYATSNLSSYPHAIKIYKLVAESTAPTSTKLYIKTGNDDWNPYVWAWNDNGNVIIAEGHDSWYNKVQATEIVEDHGIRWHKITIPSNNFSFNLSDGQGDNGGKTGDIGPITSDTYIVYNSNDVDHVPNNDYVIVDFANVTATDLTLTIGNTASSVVTNEEGLQLRYESSDTSVATIDASTGEVTGVANGTATITVSWPTTRTDDHTGWVSGSTTFQVTVAPPSGIATYIFNTDQGLEDLGIIKPTNNNGTNLGTKEYKSDLVTMTATKGTYDARVYNYNGTDLRVYKDGGSLTFTVPDSYNITNVKFEGSALYFGNDLNDSHEWNGSQNTVTFTASNNCRITTITVRYTQSATLSAPTFSPVSGTSFVNSLEVSLTADEGSAIYYTTDGTVPTAESTPYSEPFTIDATTTVNAIAVKDGLTSPVASATYSQLEAPGEPTLNPATESTVGVGSKITIVPSGNVSQVHYRINSGTWQVAETNSEYFVDVTEDMVGTLTVEAYHSYIVGDETLDGAHAMATYTVVNPVVTFDQPETVFAKSFTVTLTASPENADIYYTLDGTTPTAESTHYSGAIALDATTTVKAIAALDGVAGAVATATYQKNSPVSSSTGNIFKLVKDVSTLVKGDNILIANGEKDMVLDETDGTTTGKNRLAVSIDFLSTEIIQTEDAKKILTLKAVDNGWILQTDDTHCLYTSSSKDNILKIAEIEGFNEIYYYIASITIDEHNDAHIRYANNKEIMLNKQEDLFSCYSEENAQLPVQIYRNESVDAITLSETKDESATINENSGNTKLVNLYRQLTANMWNAICLPFDMDDAKMTELFGDGYKLRSFSDVKKEGGDVTLMFAKETTLQASVPYIVLPTKTVEQDAVVVISDVTLTKTDPKKVTIDGYTFQGIYAPKSFKAGDKSIRFIGSGNKFYYPNSTNPMRAFRAYFKLPAGTTEAKVGMSFDEDMGVATGIVAVDGGAMDGRIYSMSGQYVGTSTQGLPRGLYIRDGRKFVVK